jgi:cyclophilin family peptidyl-prolyl cis-trans isomerase
MSGFSTSSTYTYVDVNVDNSLAARSLGANFVFFTDTRYSFSSKNITELGGTELARVRDNYEIDVEWMNKGRIDVDRVTVSDRLVFRLFTDLCPITCENFLALCKGPSSPGQLGSCGKPLHYKNTPVHRVQSGFVMQAGDISMGNGSGGESIYNGKKFKDEKPGLLLKHDRRGVLSMGNSGKNANSSQFFVTLCGAPQADGKHVVFGELVSGFDALAAIETAAATADGTPKCPVDIVDCGLHGPDTPSCGYWLNVPAPDTYLGHQPVFYAFPRVCIVAPTSVVADRFAGCCRAVAHCAFTFVTGEESEIREQLAAVDVTKNDLVVVAKAVKDVVNGDWAAHMRGGVVEVGAPADVAGYFERFRAKGWVFDHRPS